MSECGSSNYAIVALILTISLAVAGGFFFASQLIVPSVVAQAKFTGQRFGLAHTDFAALF